MDSLNSYFSTYSNNSKNICILTAVAISIIFLFIVSPLNNYYFASLFGKIAVLLILAYALYENFMNSYNFSKNTNTTMIVGSWNDIKTNLLCSYIFSFLILLLFFSVIKNMIM